MDRWEVMKAQRAVLIAILVALVCVSVGRVALAQQAETSSTISLEYVSVQLSYPSEVEPGDSVGVHVLASSKDYFEMDKLALQVYIPVQSDLVKVGEGTVAAGVFMTYQSQVMKDIQFTVPDDAPATSLLAVVTEEVRVLTYSYNYYYPYYGMYYQQNTSYPYNYYLEPAYAPSKDSATTPLSYVKAADPAYANLQSQYQALSQQLNQAQSENQKLQQNLKILQDQNALLQDQNAQLRSQAKNNADAAQQLSSSQSLVLALEGGILTLTALVGVLGFLLYRRISQNNNTAKPRK